MGRSRSRPPRASSFARARATPEGLAELLAASLRPATGFRLPVVAGPRAATDGDIVLALSTGDRSLGDEGYRLVVDGTAATVTARRPAGLFWGTQTLRQLLPASIEADARRPGPWRLSRGTIHDRPRFAWRGAMLDVARHFFGVNDVKRLIDLMSLYKLNRLHLHLTDDQGWRLAIRSWPRLTSHGSRTAVGGGKAGTSRSASTRRSSPTRASGSSTWCQRSTCRGTSTRRSPRTRG